MWRVPPISTLFPYTTLFRSVVVAEDSAAGEGERPRLAGMQDRRRERAVVGDDLMLGPVGVVPGDLVAVRDRDGGRREAGDRKSTRLNSSHVEISYAVFCLKK